MALILDPDCALALLREVGWVVTDVRGGVMNEGYSDEGIVLHTEVLCEARCPCVVNWHAGAHQCAAMARWSRDHHDIQRWGPGARWRFETKWGEVPGQSAGGSYSDPEDFDQLPTLGHPWTHAETMQPGRTTAGQVVQRRAACLSALSEDLLRVNDEPEAVQRLLRALALVLRGSRLPGCAEAADRLESP